ncbi:hypothetical protein ACRAWG_36785 [Methylobacterium sp. P31]
MLDEERAGPDLPKRPVIGPRSPGLTPQADVTSGLPPAQDAGPAQRWSTRRLLTVPGLAHGRRGPA